MYTIRTFRRPRPQPSPEQMAPKFALCAGCVTPKFCREGGKCDVEALSGTKAVRKQVVSKKPKASK